MRKVSSTIVDTSFIALASRQPAKASGSVIVVVAELAIDRLLRVHGEPGIQPENAHDLFSHGLIAVAQKGQAKRQLNRFSQMASLPG